MTKSEKKTIVSNLLKEFIMSDKAEGREKLLEKIIKEIYSSGFDSVRKFQMLSKALDLFLEEIIKNKLTNNSKNWETVSCVVGLITLVDMSILPD
jgi:hypothetical protein